MREAGTGSPTFRGHSRQAPVQYKSPLLQSLQSTLRLQHLSRRTEAGYVCWSKRYRDVAITMISSHVLTGVGGVRSPAGLLHGNLDAGIAEKTAVRDVNAGCAVGDAGPFTS